MLASRLRPIVLVVLAVALVASATTVAAAAPRRGGPPDPVRFATFNASLNRFSLGQLAANLSTPNDPQAQRVAEIIQRVRPDVLLVNEFDFDPAAVDLFRDNYLEVGQNGADPIDYRYTFVAESNTGVLPDVEVNFDNNFDDDGNPIFGLPGDAFGFGFFPGQFGMLVLSRYPIATDQVRTFQTFLWRDMPGALLPDDPTTPAPADYYTDAELDVFRLSSKSHWDVPIEIGNRTVHLLAAHPTPPVFDDPVIDQNGRRNHDEIRFWADYVHPARSGYIYDDDGTTGGLQPGAPFVIVGDYNADPFDGDSVDDAANQLLDSPRINGRFSPASEGGVVDSASDGGINVTHVGDPANDTADFGDVAPGNLRVDYVLPSRQLTVRDGGVFWPTPDSPLYRLVGDDALLSSDHRLVWLDVKVPGRR